MQYQEAVAEARQLVKRSEDDQWRLAQLTWEQTQSVSQRKWAEDVGVTNQTVSRWRAIWQYKLDHPAVGGTYAETEAVIRGAGAGESLRQAESIRTVQNLPPERKAEVVREALDDQDVAVRVLRDPHTRRNVTDARERVVDEIETAARDREQASPAQRELRNTSEHFQVGNHLRLSRFHAAEAARRLQEIEDRDEDMVREFERDAQEVRDALEWFEVVSRGGRVDDEALARFLEGGAS